MLFVEWINSSYFLRLPLLKTLPNEWIAQKNEICYSFLSKSVLLRFKIVSLFLLLFSMLVIKGLIRWTVKYKLRYLFRVTSILFICNTFLLLLQHYSFTLDLKNITLYLFEWEESILFLSPPHPNTLWIISATICFGMGILRYHWALPFEIVKEGNSLCFSSSSRMSKSRRGTVQEFSEKTQKFRDPGELNPVYVNGWIPLIESREVQKKVVTVIAVGYKFCVFRGETGQVCVMDAYCPHIGADMSAGGRIVGDCIECPFHGWQFDGKSGKCTKIPYAEKIPEVARVKVWHSCERNGFIFVWHHVENDLPSWEPPSVPEVESGEWIFRGRSEFTVYCHIQEIPENGADIAHLAQVHSRFVFFGPDMDSTEADDRWIKHDWQPLWAPEEKETHIAKVKIVMRLMFKGYEVPWSRINVDIKQIGPASVYLYMDTSFGRGIFLQYITTEGPLQQRVVQELYTEPKFKPGPASFLIWGEAAMFERDIAVWNHKKFLRKPLLVKEDKLILKFRRWFSQFYSEHSPTLKDLRQRTLEW